MEIKKLDRLLTEAGIPHTMEPRNGGFQVCYPVGRGDPACICDAVQFRGSYGYEQDKLEIMGLLMPEEEKYDRVAGFLTAEDVFTRIKNHWDSRKLGN